jgi:hypothetical protein
MLLIQLKIVLDYLLLCREELNFLILFIFILNLVALTSNLNIFRGDKIFFRTFLGYLVVFLSLLL